MDIGTPLKTSSSQDTETCKIKFNPFATGFKEDPYTTYRLLRQHEPIHRALDMWVVTKYQDITHVLASDAVSVNYIPQYIIQQNAGDIPGIVELGEKAIVFTDPPEHGRLRRLASQAFNTISIQAHTFYIQQLIETLIGPKINAESINFAQIAHQIPLLTISHLLDIPDEYIGVLDENLHRVRLVLEPGLLTKLRIRRIEDDLQVCLELFLDIIQYRQSHLGEDLLSKLIQARIGEDKLSHRELAIACVMTYVAGHETSKGLLGNGVLAFATHPHQWSIFRDGKVSSKQVVDEILRFDPPLQQTVRLAVSNLQVGQQTIGKGEKMLLCIASANRDEDQFANADDFDITRDASSQIAFGHGMHNCIGQMLARLEAQFLLSYLVKHVQQIELSSTDYRWIDDGFITRTLSYLPVNLKSA
ncbi:Cytochrome P450 [Nostoc flagelliforme CCNUN1]|uniref:Cytochrome P450 n=1 Tax=Nostoc flagelliforme CCNUN1 TaxID=2038116 RepID=A0A2K8SPN1_9NOSO|nr:cytochrome P450 [Nostoc flagelliforme]AUB37424.1 Cytochrome P450 [Nostoc flagelliforme CCNUN1]